PETATARPTTGSSVCIQSSVSQSEPSAVSGRRREDRQPHVSPDQAESSRSKTAELWFGIRQVRAACAVSMAARRLGCAGVGLCEAQFERPRPSPLVPCSSESAEESLSSSESSCASVDDEGSSSSLACGACLPRWPSQSTWCRQSSSSSAATCPRKRAAKTGLNSEPRPKRYQRMNPSTEMKRMKRAHEC